MKFVVVLLLAVFVHEVVPFVSNRENVDPLGPFVDPMVEPPAPEENQQEGSFDEASPDWMTWGEDLYEGDMMLDEEQLRQLNDSSSERNAIIVTQRLWPNGIVPYEIDSDKFSLPEMENMQTVFAIYAEKTCLKMVERTNEESYVRIVRGKSCSSTVGGNRGRMQQLSLGSGCAGVRIIIHEFMHAIGFWHEQSRYDRDDYVRINYENIKDGGKGNFKKFTSSQVQHLGEPYDYNSVMHYREKAFTKNGENTIDRLDGSTDRLGGPTFTQIDLNKVNKLYNCPATTTTVTTAAPVTTPGPTTTTTADPCKDLENFCPNRKRRCKNAKFADEMAISCRKTCKICVPCEDKEKYEDRCPRWATEGHCTGKYEEFMTRDCRKSCGSC